jgi:hypothetical protein
MAAPYYHQTIKVPYCRTCHTLTWNMIIYESLGRRNDLLEKSRYRRAGFRENKNKNKKHKVIYN